MKQINKILALALALMLVLSLCACGQDANGGNTTDAPTDPVVETTAPTEKPTEAPTEATIPEGMVQYKVKVTDEAGNPVVGVMVQLCTDVDCLAPVKTDDAGVATFLAASEEEFHANIMPNKTPEGFEENSELYYFADGETELTIVLKAIA